LGGGHAVSEPQVAHAPESGEEASLDQRLARIRAAWAEAKSMFNELTSPINFFVVGPLWLRDWSVYNTVVQRIRAKKLGECWSEESAKNIDIDYFAASHEAFKNSLKDAELMLPKVAQLKENFDAAMGKVEKDLGSAGGWMPERPSQMRSLMTEITGAIQRATNLLRYLLNNNESLLYACGRNGGYFVLENVEKYALSVLEQKEQSDLEARNIRLICFEMNGHFVHFKGWTRFHLEH
jgi:hypothetical protein